MTSRIKACAYNRVWHTAGGRVVTRVRAYLQHAHPMSPRWVIALGLKLE